MTATHKFALSAAALLLSACLAGCAQQEQEEGPDYADDEAVAAIADGLEERSDVADAHRAEGTDQTTKALVETTQVEIDAVAPMRNRQFEDSRLQEAVLAYANLLDDMKTAAESSPIDDIDFIQEWTALYGERFVAIKEFVDDWGLTVDEAHQTHLDEILRNATAVEAKADVEEAAQALVASMAFEMVDNGYGFYTYTAVAENTTGIDFGSFSIRLDLYDADGVKVEETHAFTSSWPSGEKVKFEAFSQTAAAEARVTVDTYQAQSS